MLSRSLTTRNLRTDSLPMRLYEQAKAGGGWNPSHLDFSVDEADWDKLDGENRVPILALTVLGAHGLRTQLRNHSTLMAAVERHGTIEESLCYSSHLFETARYVELYNCLLGDIFHLLGDPQRFHIDRFESFFGEQMPQVIEKLQACTEPANLAEAMTLAGPLGKGVLGTTCQYAFIAVLDRLDIMPTVRAAVRDLQQAYRRHTEFDAYFIGKLVRQEPAIWEVVDETMHAGFEPAIAMVRGFFDKFSTGPVARAEAVTYVVERFSKHYEQLERVKEPTFIDGPDRLGPGSISPRI